MYSIVSGEYGWWAWGQYSHSNVQSSNWNENQKLERHDAINSKIPSTGMVCPKFILTAARQHMKAKIADSEQFLGQNTKATPL